MYESSDVRRWIGAQISVDEKQMGFGLASMADELLDVTSLTACTTRAV
jgi:hypothetical protein